MAYSKEGQYADVSIELPLDHPFCYQLPSPLQGRVRPGSLVLVPFRNRRVTGIVVEVHQNPPKTQDIKEILQLLEEEPFFGETDLAWFRWAAEYYIYPLGRVLRGAFPPGFRLRRKSLVRLTEAGMKMLRRDPSVCPELASMDNGGRWVRIDTLTRRWDRGRVEVLMNHWQDQGLVETSEHSGWSQPGLRRLRLVRLTPFGRQLSLHGGHRGLKVGRRQDEVMQLLVKEGELPLVAIERIIPGARGSLRGLEKRGLTESRYEGARLGRLDYEEAGATHPPRLTSHQSKIVAKIQEAMSKGSYRGCLLWGVTGSGKTEIYLRATEVSLEAGNQVLILVPEISLTHQLVREFLARFGERIGILHSRLSQGERSEMWRAIHQSKVPIVLGARSALFAPFFNLGLIIVDEEHDDSYKQEEGFKYHARDLALVRGKLSGCVVLLGSATPSLETFHNARGRKLTLLELPERIEGRALPDAEVVDLRHQRRRGHGGSGILSGALKGAMEDTLGKGEQILLFLNRRGYATFLQCPDCGYVFQCRNCAVSMVYHRSDSAHRCHYCGWSHPAPALCPECNGMDVKDLGLGTETLEEVVKTHFSQARVLRMDRDTTARKNAQREILRIWRKGEADVLIGTQMVAKGHHVPNVTLVGVVLADISLNFPDFRASERTFQLLLQVAGRAGRGERPGRVIIQTYNPYHPSIHYAVTQDYHGFVRQELKTRELAVYPPFCHLVLFRITGPGEEQTASAAQIMGGLAGKICEKREGLTCLGPSPAPLARLKGRYRWNVLLKGKSRPQLHRVARRVLEAACSRLSSRRVRLTVDVDPQSFL